MSGYCNNILSVLRFISFVCVLYSQAIQPIVSSFIIIDEISNEIVCVDVEENSSDNENQENEEKEEFEKISFSNSFFDSIEFELKILILNNSKLLRDIALDTHIPPPETA
ncbi:hypothetical protein [uncultured Tenacibaculum sp.]|uniref:hypothetical protein n=1 Tax=uncultured Tenacibaculum sp. TaxID=174713 RepID=UPI0026381123|nr:hypothetical protein [uncultured Tenacibaculum sp.]